MCNRQASISHTVREMGFKYDILKGELSHGCIISKSVHPISEVEVLKEKLLGRNYLKNAGTHWILKKNIRTGLLMAVNLHLGYFVAEPPYKQDIIVTSEEADKLRENLEQKHVCVSNSDIVMKSLRDTLRLSSVNIMEVNQSIFKHHEPNTFAPEEAFVLRILQNRGVISSSARHGISERNEADIVDEIRKEQFEVVYEFKTELSKKKMKPGFIFSPEILVLQLVDNPFIHTSNALKKKFMKKYIKQYRPNLVILTFGTEDVVISMLESLSDNLYKEDNVELNFSQIYIVSLDFLREQALFFRISATGAFHIERFPCKNDELGFIKLTPICFETIEDTRKYLMICDGIFDRMPRCLYDDGNSLKAWAKAVNVSNIQFPQNIK